MISLYVVLFQMKTAKMNRICMLELEVILDGTLKRNTLNSVAIRIQGLSETVRFYEIRLMNKKTSGIR